MARGWTGKLVSAEVLHTHTHTHTHTSKCFLSVSRMLTMTVAMMVLLVE